MDCHGQLIWRLVPAPCACLPPQALLWPADSNVAGLTAALEEVAQDSALLHSLQDLGLAPVQELLPDLPKFCRQLLFLIWENVCFFMIFISFLENVPAEFHQPNPKKDPTKTLCSGN